MAKVKAFEGPVWQADFKWTVKDFPKLKDGARLNSKKFKAGSFMWFLSLDLNGPHEPTHEFVSLYLKHQPEEGKRDGPDPGVHDFEITVLNHVGLKAAAFGTTACFSKSNASWGWSRFIERARVLDPSQGLLDSHGNLWIQVIIKTPRLPLSVASRHAGFLTVRYSNWQHRPHSKMWDMKLQTDDGHSVHADRATLVLFSPYLQRQLEGEGVDMSVKELSVPDAKATALTIVVEGMYSNMPLRLGTVERAAEVLELVDRLQIDSMREECEAYLLQQLTVDTAPSIYAAAHKHGAQSVQKIARDFVSRHLLDCVRGASGTELSNLPPADVAALLRDAALAGCTAVEVAEVYEVIHCSKRQKNNQA